MRIWPSAVCGRSSSRRIGSAARSVAMTTSSSRIASIAAARAGSRPAGVFGSSAAMRAPSFALWPMDMRTRPPKSGVRPGSWTASTPRSKTAPASNRISLPHGVPAADGDDPGMRGGENAQAGRQIRVGAQRQPGGEFGAQRVGLAFGTRCFQDAQGVWMTVLVGFAPDMGELVRGERPTHDPITSSPHPPTLPDSLVVATSAVAADGVPHGVALAEDPRIVS